MYHILFPVDDNESHVRAQLDAVRGFPFATDEVHVDVLHVYEEIDAPADEGGSLYIDQVNENLADLQGLPETVNLTVEELEAEGLETSVHDVPGEPAVAILELAEEYDVDLIVVGTRRRRPIGKVVFGSVAQSVIIDSDRPVVVATG